MLKIENKIISNKPINIKDYLWDVLKYKSLIYFLSKRDFITFYKQTVLGPIWYLIQPLLSSFVFLIIFNRLAKIPTSGEPGILFYMAGTIFWTFFSDSLNRTSRTLIDNVDLYGKVYFPRLVSAISAHLITFLKLSIQFLLFLILVIYYIVLGYDYSLSKYLFLLPFLILNLTLISLGFGLLMASMTIKYRDFIFALTFGLQLLMYATPVVYSFDIIPNEYKLLASLNPVAPVLELIKDVIFNHPLLDFKYYFVSLVITIFTLLISIKMFLNSEKDFIDKI